MNFSAALGFPFRGKSAWSNLGLLLVCFIIPIVGPIVALGYIIGVEKILIANIHADAPRFDFGRFSNYLMRGLYPFVASLLAMLILYALLIPIVVIFVLLFLLAQKSAAGIGVLIALAVLAYLVLIFGFGAIIQPMMFKSGLEGSFQAAFDRPFVLSYLKRVGWLSVGVQVLVMLMFIPLVLLMCIPLVGPGVAMALLMMVQAHLNTQIYLIYLNRGGQTLAIKDDPLEQTGFPVLPPSPATAAADSPADALPRES